MSSPLAYIYHPSSRRSKSCLLIITHNTFEQRSQIFFCSFFSSFSFIYFYLESPGGNFHALTFSVFLDLHDFFNHFKMRYAFVASALVASASAHGLVTSIEGANGVSMPGLSGKSRTRPKWSDRLPTSPRPSNHHNTIHEQF
jgi:hypothetical protein